MEVPIGVSSLMLLVGMIGTFLLGLLGVPVEAVTIVAGIGPLVGMFLCMSNCFGDIVATSIVAKSENMTGSESPLRAGRSA